MTAASGRVECMKTLLHHGAQINSTDDNNVHGFDTSSIFWNIWHVSRHFSNTKLLISHVRDQSKNQAIHYSSMKGHNDILVKLIEKGADVDLLKDPMAERRISRRPRHQGE